jgi:hypothetical protein
MPDTPATTPPYISFRTFWNFIEELHEHLPLPQVIDSSVLGSNRSGAARSQLLIALRFFGLIDDDKRPTARLQELVESPDQAKLRAMLEKYYAPVIAIDLETAAGSQFDEALRDLGAGQGSTLRKARTFFLNAADEAGIEVGRTLKQAPGPPRTTRPRARRKRRAPQPIEAEFTPSPSPRTGQHPLIQGLLMQLPDSGSWTATDRKRWLDVAGGVLDMLFEVEDSSSEPVQPSSADEISQG